MTVSLIVVPKRLQETVDRCLPELNAVVRRLREPVELICVEDAACPSPPRAVAALEAAWPGVRLLSVDPPLGRSTLIEAAIAAATGDAICTVDGSGHYPADEILRLLTRLVRLDAVFGYRRLGMLGRVATLGMRVLRRESALRDPACLLWAARREAVAGLPCDGCSQARMAAEIARRGFRVGQVRVEYRPEIAPLGRDRSAWAHRSANFEVAYRIREHLTPARKRAAA
ncbi:MAG TPA: glycosyltransferase [Pirellulales bacterium]|jgi:hypothetical protein|nr:glycosyltransferase [Pirellulales bacterium]